MDCDVCIVGLFLAYFFVLFFGFFLFPCYKVVGLFFFFCLPYTDRNLHSSGISRPLIYICSLLSVHGKKLKTYLALIAVQI